MSKRKRVVLNFQQKLDILQQLNEGKSGAILAREYGIGTSTISDIRRNKDAILQFVSKLECRDQISEKKTRKTAQNADLDSIVYKWYCEEKKKGGVLPDATVCAKALEVNKQLTNANLNFKASPGWLRHFKNRHGIREVRGQSGEANGGDIRKQFRNVVKRGGYTQENVYNVDDGFLLWKSLPECDSKGGNVVTVIACTNANGSHKLPLCIIGQDRKCLAVSNHSVIYRVKQSVETDFFIEWFEDVFVPQVKNRQEVTGNVGKVLLVIDDASWHPHRDVLVKNSHNIDVFILPDTFTPEIQPIETEIKRFKIIYRKKLLELLSSKSPYPIKQFLEEFTLKECISIISEAWDSVPRTHIVQSWAKLLSDGKNETEFIHSGVSEIVEIARRIAGLDCNIENITRWLECDKEEYCFYSLESSEEFFSETEEKVVEEQAPSDMEAYHCFDTAIRWFTKQKECNNEELSVLESLRQLAARKLCSGVKQEIE